ncbi:hypothetical protein [Nocardia kruczakiae]|uniref:hypothetical protein n=1 Tax=Nocardia kruczakiae TaxID=261477 RepID=UPI000AD87DF4|nr:hypothetical protein [Nocardia kruczakiae]
MTPPPEPSSYLDQGSGEFLRRLDAMSNSFYAGMVSGSNTQAWDADQLALQQQINVLADQLRVDVDPQSIAGGDNFENLTLEQIRDLTFQIKPDVVHAVSEAWSNIGSGLADGADTARKKVVQDAIANGWEGAAGQKAAQTFGRVLDSVADIGRSASMVAMKIAFAQRGSDETFRMLAPLLQAMVPSGTGPILPPGSPTLGPAAAPTGPQLPILAEQQDKDSQKEEARQAALQVLRNVYSPGIRGGDQAVPVLPTVYPAAAPGGPVGPAGPGPVSPVPGPSNSGGGDQNPRPGEVNPGSDPNTGTDGNQSQGTQPSSATPSNGQNPSSTTSSSVPNAASTTAAGFDPSGGLGGGTSGSGLGGGLHGSGSGGGSHGSGLGGLSGSGGGTARPGLGSSIPGGPVALPAAASLGGLRAPGQPGAAGTPGMSPGAGGKGKSEEDKDRRSAEYLRGQHLEEWIEDGRRVLPAYGAIGDESSQQQPPAARSANPPDRGRAPGEYR